MPYSIERNEVIVFFGRAEQNKTCSNALVNSLEEFNFIFLQ